MRAPSVKSWKHEFAKSAAYRREQEFFAKEVDRRIKEDRKDERIEDDLTELAAIALLASETDIGEFRARLDAYDAATTEALIENARLREITQAKIDELLGDAYVLPDGRRVFKTKDGRVIDEHGVEIGADEVDPDLIEDWRPGGEDYILALEEKEKLDQEHAELLEFQERIDEAREEIEADDLTKQDIADIEAELEAAMPMAARKNTPDYEHAATTDVRKDFAAAVSPASIAVPDLKRDLQQLIQ
ncbi:MAG: hypothetical protein AB7F76_00810 [Parvibaculaceae bacterium]